MGQNDDIDRRRASQYAWTWAKPGDIPRGILVEEAGPDQPPEEARAREDDELLDGDDEDEDAGPFDPEATAAARAAIAEARERAGELAAAAIRVDAIADPAAQRRALTRLLEQIHALGFGAAGLCEHPAEHVRLARLVVRHWDLLPGRAQDHSLFTFLFLDADHPEITDLLVESARNGDETLFSRLYLALHGEEGLAVHKDRLVPRMAEVLESGDAAARGMAVRWLSILPGRAAAPALRAALRDADPVVRWRALDVLLDLPPGELRAEDVDALVHRALFDPPTQVHPWDEERARVIEHYPDSLAKAVVQVRPEGAKAPLLRIARRDLGDSGWRDCLDDDWALETLAAAFPDEALPLLDRRMLQDRVHDRRQAVAAIARLPDAERAADRLRDAARDLSPEVAQAARDAWLARFASPLLLDEIEVVPPALRPPHPSDAFRSRLAVLRGPSEEARHAMAEVLLAEPPDAENLALLIVALGDEHQHDRPERPGLPQDRKAWTQAILARHGSAAATGLAFVARRQPIGVLNWWFTYEHLAHEGVLPEDSHPALRDAAADWLTSPAWDKSGDVLRLLAAIGAPNALRAPLLALVLDEDPEAIYQAAAAAVFAAWPPDDLLDQRLLVALREAHGGERWTRVEHLLEAALPRRLPEAVALAATYLRSANDELPFSLRNRAAFLLREIDRLPDAFVARMLAQPAHPAFAVACSLARRKRTPREGRLLHAALESSAREGAAAVEALEVLVSAGRVDANDRRVPGILARAPLDRLPWILAVLLMKNARVRPLEPALKQVFTAADPDVTGEVAENLPHLLVGVWGGRALLHRLRPLIEDDELGYAVDEQLEQQAELGGMRRRHRRRSARRRTAD